jgi:branched-chain amino acid transport system permease protein
VLLGVLLSYVGGYLGSDLVLLYGLAALALILMIRPSGLLAAPAGRRV